MTSVLEIFRSPWGSDSSRIGAKRVVGGINDEYKIENWGEGGRMVRKEP